MKKILLAISVLLFGTSVVAGFNTVKVSADEEISSSEVVEQATYTVSYETYYLENEVEVKDETLTRGDVLLSITEGKVGDKVTALVQSNPGFERDGSNITTFKYLVKSVYFNGEVLNEIEEGTGKYEFVIVEGTNIFKVIFDGIGKITSNDLLNVDWLSLLTVDNLLTLVSYIIMVGLSSGFFVTLLKSKKIKNETINKVTEAVNVVSKTALGEEAQKFLESQMKPILDQMGEQYKTIAKEMETLVKCTMLAQENTPEARLAITNELVSMEQADQELGEKVKNLINDAIKSNEEKKEAIKTSIEEVKQSIAEIGVEETKDLIDDIKL